MCNQIETPKFYRIYYANIFLLYASCHLYVSIIYGFNSIFKIQFVVFKDNVLFLNKYILLL